MEFFTSASEKRPVRLSEATRQFAWDSLHGKYGDEAERNFAVEMDFLPEFETMSGLDRYDAAIRAIAQRAPLRICPAERVCGAATLGLAIGHRVPVTFRGKDLLAGVSHLTLNFERLLKDGLEGYRERILAKMQTELTDEQLRFEQSLLNAVDSFVIWHGRYLDLAREESAQLCSLLERVPLHPARSFHEAVQTVWMEFAFARLCGIWPGIGRLDVLLGEYLERDLESSVLTLDEAREILASLFIKGCEWIRSEPPTGSGDAQHYQNIVLGGVDGTGREVTNEVTYLVLDIVEELAISDFPITVRVNENTPQKLIRRMSQVIRHGGGIVAVYNEGLILKALERNGYTPEEAARFANDGCWEVQIPGCTDFSYIPFDGLAVFEKAIGLDKEEFPGFENEDGLFAAFLSALEEKVREIYRDTVEAAFYFDGERWRGRWGCECSVVALFEDDCIDRAAGYYDLGTRYTLRSPHIGGAADIANSILAIRRLVFEEKKVSFEELRQMIKNDWSGAEEPRLMARHGIEYYGNDSDEADAIMARVLNGFADTVEKIAREHSDCPVRFIPGVSTFGRQIEWRYVRHATAFGYRAGEILSGNASPTPGTDAAGLTAVIRSHCKADLVRQTSGAALDIRIAGSTLSGEQGIAGLSGLIMAFVRLGGFFLQADTVSAETLRAAAADPESYKTLSVRVSGWNARFVTLNREWQEMIIRRTEQGA